MGALVLCAHAHAHRTIIHCAYERTLKKGKKSHEHEHARGKIENEPKYILHNAHAAVLSGDACALGVALIDEQVILHHALHVLQPPLSRVRRRIACGYDHRER